MIDWLRRSAAEPNVQVGGRTLPLVVRRHARAKRMILRLGRDGQAVDVTVPPWGRTADALAFARSRAGWLAEQLARCPEPAVRFDADRIAYRGEPLQVAWAEGHPRRPLKDGVTLLVGGPHDALPARLKRWLMAEAERILVDDAARYAARAGLPPPRLRLSNAGRRWGSCGADGTVRINWRLVQAPDCVRRSVVAHEVAHLVHFNHSPAFHACLRDLFDGDLPAADAWLKQHGRALYRQFG